MDLYDDDDVVEIARPANFGEARTERRCKDDVLALFPDICPEYLGKLCKENSWIAEVVITRLVDDAENARPYPKVSKKRKREDDSDEEGFPAVADYEKLPENRIIIKDPAWIDAYLKTMKDLLRKAFPKALVRDITTYQDLSNKRAYQTYMRLYAHFSNIQTRGNRKPIVPLSDTEESQEFARSNVPAQVAAHTELLQAEKNAAEGKRREEEAARLLKEEEENLKIAEREGTLQTCECCGDDGARNRMVYCNGDILHWFCKECMLRRVESLIGEHSSELRCFSMVADPMCTAGFSRDQQDIFLDAKTKTKLHHIDQMNNLRGAGIENLVECPFCHYAEECPPVEEDREFRCKEPTCEQVTCRLCQKPTHIPLSCEEAERVRSQDHGYTVRRTIEEAMSSALIRKCNKCKKPFIKESGCNKVYCPTCHNTQCYCCGANIQDYQHFNDPNRGGKEGNCPLFDGQEKRHVEEVQRAEEAARQLALAQNPEISAEHLEIRLSEAVRRAEAQRLQVEAQRPGVYPPRPPLPHPFAPVPRNPR